MKIVYNDCFGGFSLSRAAVLRAREISGDPKWGGATIEGDIYSDSGKRVDHDYGHVYDIRRSDPILVQVVEELGSKANGGSASLAIAEVPSGTSYRIDEYDGNEQVMTRDDYDWETAE